MAGLCRFPPSTIGPLGKDLEYSINVGAAGLVVDTDCPVGANPFIQLGSTVAALS
jgi:hypothetical protein